MRYLTVIYLYESKSGKKEWPIETVRDYTCTTFFFINQHTTQDI